MIHLEVELRKLGYSAVDFCAMTLPELYERICIHAKDGK